MIVVDTGSKDRTKEVATALGARVFEFPWCDDFAAARNESLRHGRGEWLFWMDSDDTIDAENGRKLREVARTESPTNVLGYVMQVHCPGIEADGRIGTTVVDHVKLVRNRPGMRFEFRIHEQILPAIRQANGDVGWTDIFVVHSGSDQTPAGKKRKLARDLRLLHLELLDRPGHPFALFNLGMTYGEMGLDGHAIDILRRCLAVSSTTESHLRKAYALIVNSYMRLHRFQEGWDACAAGRKQFPDDPELLYREAMLSHNFGRLAEAEAAYRAVLTTKHELHFSSIDDGIVGYKARHNLALVLADAGKHNRAEFEWRRILDEKPDYELAWRGLGTAMIRQIKLISAQVLTENLLASTQRRAAGLYLQAELLLARGEWQSATQSLRELVALNSNDTGPLQLLSQILFERAAADEAAIALEELIHRCPDDAAAHHNLGTTYLRMGALSKAVIAYRESLVRRPSAAFTWNQLGLALEQTGDREHALAAFEDALRHDPKNAVASEAIARLRSTRVDPVAELPAVAS
jgi:tetratricopeptide (TPR) repeat protein